MQKAGVVESTQTTVSHEPVPASADGHERERVTVRDSSFDVFRMLGLRTFFSNPGSTEIPLLASLPADFDFVLALHEGSVVGAATGYALARDEPALVLLHTVAGLGNAVAALATARMNRASLVVVVGQQDRRHLMTAPFLAGSLDGLAGSYPVWTAQPMRAQDVPSALARAWHESRHARGPAVVIVPMDDWDQPAEKGLALTAPSQLNRTTLVDEAGTKALEGLLAGAAEPGIVVGAGADSQQGWAAVTQLAERLECDVWQEAFGARAGFPQNHPSFRGHLPSDRGRLREALSLYDVVLAVGAPAFRQYGYAAGPFVHPGTQVAVVTDDAAQAFCSSADVAVLADPEQVCRHLARVLPAAHRLRPAAQPDHSAAVPSANHQGLRAAQVFDALACALDPETVIVEETPSSRPDLHRHLPARRPFTFLSAANGALGFAMPAAVGIRMAQPDRPVVAILGDGSSLYAIQALWTAAHYNVGVLFVVLANGRYAVMDRLAEAHGGKGPWPGLDNIDIPAIARGFACESVCISEYDELTETLSRVVPRLSASRSPLLLNIQVESAGEFRP